MIESRINRKHFTMAFVASIALGAQFASADHHAMTGETVPELTAFDDAMQTFMHDFGVSAAVLGVSKDGCVIYQRGFGYNVFPSWPMWENTPMRLASVEKPLTASIIRDLANNGYPDLLNANVFNLGQPGGGIITLTPWNGLGDERLKQITVNDLLQHRGGWDVDLMTWCDSEIQCDPQFQAVFIAEEMEINSPPGRVNTIRYMLSQQLSHPPGTTYAYSNFGFMILGIIVEGHTGQTVPEALGARILTPDLWIPQTEMFLGRTFADDQSPREPKYLTADLVTNVFDPDGDDVIASYGGWDHESFHGHGNMVASAAPLLKFLDSYQIVGNGIGMPIPTGTGDGNHNGDVNGSNTIALQRPDGINIVVLINDSEDDEQPHLATAASMRIEAVIDSGQITEWPTRCVDGSWVNFGAPESGFGGFSDAFNNMDDAMAATSDGTKLHFQVGSSGPWSGTIDKTMLWDCPWGSVVIGE